MKKLLIAIYLLFSLSAFAIQAPKIVADAFQKKFSGATNVKWEKEKENEYEAIFELQGKKMSANFNLQGQWLFTSTDVGLDGLPAVARVVLQTRFIDWDITSVNKIEKADSTQHYHTSLVKDKLLKEVLIKANGDILNK